MLCINQELCAQCGLCQENCPAVAIDVNSDGLYEIDATLCTDCESCISDCPFEAIEFVESDA